MFTADFFVSSTINGNDMKPLSETIDKTKKLTEPYSNNLKANSPYPDTSVLCSLDKCEILIYLE